MLYYILAGIFVVTMVLAFAMPQKRELKYYCGNDIGELDRDYGKIYLGVVMVALSLVTAFQQETSDLISYREVYEDIGGYSFSKAYDYATEKKDTIYHMCSYLFSRSGLDFRVWRTLIAVYFNYSLYRLISRYSSNVAVSLLAVLSLELYGFTLTGLRQTVAMATLMFTYRFLREKKLIPFILLVLVASMFHSTALIFFFVYPIYQLKVGMRSMIIMGVLALFVGIYFQQMLSFVVNYLGVMEDYIVYFEQGVKLSMSGTLIYGCILLFAILFLYMRSEEVYDRALCHVLIISWVFRLLSALAFAEMFRFAMYYSLFDSLLIADGCSSWQKKNGMVAADSVYKTFIIAVIFVIYYVISPPSNVKSFLFIWESAL